MSLVLMFSYFQQISIVVGRRLCESSSINLRNQSRSRTSYDANLDDELCRTENFLSFPQRHSDFNAPDLAAALEMSRRSKWRRKVVKTI